MNLYGVYEQKVDVKGRVLLPSAFKKQLSQVLEEGFIIKKSIFNKCLELYPQKQWDIEVSRINKLNRFVRKNNDFIRLFMAGVKTVELDDASRFLIPKDLLSFADIDKDIVLSSSITKIELWDKVAYESFIETNITNFGDLAEDVMGVLNNEE